jgi:uncharacterized membrane protein YdjX (TVP38/TMEM64 family)
MASESPLPRKKLPLVPLGIAAVVVGAAALLVARGLDYKALVAQGLALLRSMGPWTFFSGMALLPALSFPLSAFTLLAGELFAPLLTLPGVILASLVAIGLDLALTYWLARYALRPLLSGLATRYGYAIPKVTPSNALSVALAVRLTPGPPFFVQGYLLGMAEVPFRMYMVVSMVCQLPWALGCIILGKGLFNGNFTTAIYGVSVLVLATLAIQWIRKRNAARAT